MQFATLTKHNRVARIIPIHVASVHHITQEPRWICVPNENSRKYISLLDIVCLKSEGNYTRVFVRSGKSFITSKALKYYAEKLERNNAFCRIHQSFLVRLSAIDAIHNASEISLVAIDLRIPISRRARPALLKSMRDISI